MKMGVIWSAEADGILGVGHSLQPMGVRNWALTREQTLAALDRFAGAGIGILGGDVYARQDGQLQPTYDSWHCDVEVGEATPAFVSRSIEEARRYVMSYQSGGRAEYFFVMVPLT